jgi:hypothetical protein
MAFSWQANSTAQSTTASGEVVHWIPMAVNLSFLDWKRYFFFQVAPQLSS